MEPPRSVVTGPGLAAPIGPYSLAVRAGGLRDRPVRAPAGAARHPGRRGRPGRYDYIACLAGIHHVPFATVAGLRQALAPGGVLAILGCYRRRTPADHAVALAAAPVNAAARLAVAAMERARRRGAGDLPRAPVTPALMTLGQVRAEAAALLPGCTVRRLLLWRYLLVFHRREIVDTAAARASCTW
jgi:hypothetical protein